MSEVDECFEKGLLKETAKSKRLALQDLEQAGFFLNESFDLIDMKKDEVAAITLYSAVFHAARALLHKDGVKEKSHYCLQKYLEERYGRGGKLSSDELSLFDILRGMRQEVQYNVTKVKIEENLDDLYNRAEDFIEKAKKLLKGKSEEEESIGEEEPGKGEEAD